MLETIVSIQPKDSGGSGGETRESVVYRLADDMLEKLPSDFIPHEVRRTLITASNVCVCYFTLRDLISPVLYFVVFFSF